LRRHLLGESFALDDLISRHERDPDYADVIAEVHRVWLTPDEASQFEALIAKLEIEGR
jgi:hypothetical protein